MVWLCTEVEDYSQPSTNFIFLLPSILYLRAVFSCIPICIEKHELGVHEGKAQGSSRTHALWMAKKSLLRFLYFCNVYEVRG